MVEAKRVGEGRRGDGEERCHFCKNLFAKILYLPRAL